MEITEKKSGRFSENQTESFVSLKKANEILSVNNDYVDKLRISFNIKEDEDFVLQIGNAKSLLKSLAELDSLCEKVDIITKIRDVKLEKMLEGEKAIFNIFNITEQSILSATKSDMLPTESRYSAKSDIFEYYNLCKFANYCRDKKYDDLIKIIKEYLEKKNIDNEDSRKIRLIYPFKDKKYYIRAITSVDRYNDYGINFSVYIALLSLNQYVKDSKQPVFINQYSVTDSIIYISFSMGQEIHIPNTDLYLSFNLILQNDEIKQRAVSYTGVYKLTYKESDKKESFVYLKPAAFRKDNEITYKSDLLSYSHSLNVQTVHDKIQGLPTTINYYIKLVSELSIKLTSIKDPEEMKKYIVEKIKRGNKEEFKQYKKEVIEKLMLIKVYTVFELFNLLRSVELRFEDDVLPLNYWRTKLYEALITDIRR